MTRRFGVSSHRVMNGIYSCSAVASVALGDAETCKGGLVKVSDFIIIGQTTM